MGWPKLLVAAVHGVSVVCGICGAKAKLHFAVNGNHNQPFRHTAKLHIRNFSRRQ